jgi:predicted nuclease of predicted toxin-antitoxin system
MRIKLDECVDARLVWLIKRSGHEVSTVREPNMLGTSYQALYEHCITASWVLVTLDKNFSNTLHYPPGETPGLVILRAPNYLFSTMRIVVETFLTALGKSELPLKGRLWIVEPGRVRIHEHERETNQSGDQQSAP